MTEMREMQFSWERELPGTPEQVWDAITVHSDGWLWPIAYEPRVGGAERGLTSDGGAVTTWEPARRFGTRAERPDGWFNELAYELEPSGAGTRARYRHATVTGPDEDHDLMARACDLHTDFYGHSLGEYVEHFAGRDAAYASLDAPDASAQPGGFERLLRALGLADDAAVGARVSLRPAGLPPVDAVVGYRTPHFLGLRTGDGLIRIFGRDTFGWPVGVTLHLLAPGADATALEQAWRAWLEGVYATEGSVA
jgi:hypothetical protein